MEEVDKCSICLEEITASSKAAAKDRNFLLKTLCNHVFHRICLQDWFKRGSPGNSCPLCKQILKEKDAIPVSFKNYKTPLRRSSRISALASIDTPVHTSMTTTADTETIHEMRVGAIASMIMDVLQQFVDHPDDFTMAQVDNFDNIVNQFGELIN